MSNNEPKLIKNFFIDKNSRLKSITQRAAELAKLDSVFKSLICPNLVGHCNLVSSTSDSITLSFDNASMAMAFHYAIPDILKKLNCYQEYKNIKSINCKMAK